MKVSKRIILILAIAFLVMALTMTFVSCADASNVPSNQKSDANYQGTYYEYNDNVKDPDSWVVLEDDNWYDDEGFHGRLEFKDGILYLYWIFFGDEELFVYGTVKNGVFAYTDGEESSRGIEYYNAYADNARANWKDSDVYYVSPDED